MTLTPGMIHTVAGTGEKGYAGDGGPAIRALLNEPFMCAFDAQGNLYVAEAINHCIRRIDYHTGIITTVAGHGTPGYSGDGGLATRATLNQPYALQIDTHGDIYIVDRLNAVIRKVAATTGQITTVAGTGEPGFSGDGGQASGRSYASPTTVFWTGAGAY
jgi:hypothetical protein